MSDPKRKLASTLSPRSQAIAVPPPVASPRKRKGTASSQKIKLPPPPNSPPPPRPDCASNAATDVPKPIVTTTAAIPPPITKKTEPPQVNTDSKKEEKSDTNPTKENKNNDKSNNNSDSNSAPKEAAKQLSVKKLAPPTIPQQNSQSGIVAAETKQASFPFEKIFNGPERQEYKLTQITNIPEDYIVIETFPKFHRTEYGYKPSSGDTDKLEPYVAICYASYSQEYILTRTKMENYKKHITHSSVYEAPLAKQISECVQPPDFQFLNKKESNTKLDQVDSAAIDYQKLLPESDDYFEFNKPITKRVLEVYKRNRTRNRLRLVDCYDPDYNWEPGTEIALCSRIRQTQRPDSKDSSKAAPFQFTFTPKSLTFQLGDCEPFFAAAAIFELKADSCQKISETVCFDVNADEINLMLPAGSLPPRDTNVGSATTLFSVTDRNKNMYMVFEIDKIFHGDISGATDPYCKYGTLSKEKDREKQRSKISNIAKTNCTQFGTFKQSFGWAVVPLFDPKGTLISKNGYITVTEIYSYPKEPIKDLLTLNSMQDTKRFGKNLFGELLFEVKKVSAADLEDFNFVDHSLQPVLDAEKKLESAFRREVVREVREFPRGPVFLPHFEFVNNMYVYPLSVNLSKTKAKNICAKIEVKALDDASARPLKIIYARDCRSGFVDSINTTVQFKLNAAFTEEFKILLPPSLTPKHHILFTFYSINPKPKKDAPVETIVGYAVMPLYAEGRIVVPNAAPVHQLPVATKLESGYLDPSAVVHYLDSGKPLLNLEFTLNSTIYPQDAGIAELCKAYHKSESEMADKAIIIVIQNLRKQISTLLAVQYLPIILDMLLEILLNRGESVAKEAFSAMVHICHCIKQHKFDPLIPRSSLLELYSNYMFNQTLGTHRSVYHKICFNFLFYMMAKKFETEPIDDSIYENSWFFFDLVIKSMILELAASGKLNCTDRTDLFPDDFNRLLLKLLANLVKYFKSKMGTSKALKDIHTLNKNLALFIKDLFSIYDRGLVLDIIKQYVNEMTDVTQDDLSSSFRYEFLVIVSDHDHFVQLNLPFKYDYEAYKKYAEVDGEVKHTKNALANIIITDILETLGRGSIKACTEAINALYSIIIKCANDQKLADQFIGQEVASIFFDCITLLVERWHSIKQWRDNAPICDKWEFYFCILNTLTSCSKTVIHDWWSSENTTKISTFFDILKEMIRVFEFDSTQKARATKSLLSAEIGLFISKVGTEEMKRLLRNIQGRKVNPADELERVKRLCTEVYLTILNVTVEYSEKIALTNPVNPHPLLPKLFSVLMVFMQRDFSEKFSGCLYSALRTFVIKYSTFLFWGDNHCTETICWQILRHCYITNTDLNCKASTLLYLLLNANYREVGNFGRIATQSINSLSKLVNQGLIKDDKMLRYSFLRLSAYALNSYSVMNDYNLIYYPFPFDVVPTDPELVEQKKKLLAVKDCYSSICSKFCRAVQGLADTLSAILSDTLQVQKLKETAEPQQIAELYHSIAKGYVNMPDLRVAWLQNLADVQEESQNFAEAAVVYTHIAALLTDHLVSTDRQLNELLDTSVFSVISPNISEFSDGEGLCQSEIFTEGGLTTTISKAVELFKKADLQEFGAQLLKISMPIHEKNNNYQELAKIGLEIHALWNELAKNAASPRLLPEYFRLGFYGKKFGEMDGCQYIYKTPKLTHLFAFQDELKSLYKKTLGVDILILDSNKSTQELDASACYIQLTKVKPYCSLKDRKVKDTVFKQNTGVAHFVFESPFSKSGKAHADSVDEQYKRKTILATQQTFPGMLTRSIVKPQQVREIIVTPIENATEELMKQAVTLQQKYDTRDPKQYQQVLQGSVLLQVNSGAIEFCRVFLGNSSKYSARELNQLIFALQQFIDGCGKLIELNNELANSTQQEQTFHSKLRDGYETLRGEIEEFINTTQSSMGLSTDLTSDSITTQDGDLSDEEEMPRTPRTPRNFKSSATVTSTSSLGRQL